MKVMGVPVNLRATPPVFMSHVVSLSPFVVPDILVVVFLVGVVLSEDGCAAAEREGEGGDSEYASNRSSHEFSSDHEIPEKGGDVVRKVAWPIGAKRTLVACTDPSQR
jgi:hypothetical protein